MCPLYQISLSNDFESFYDYIYRAEELYLFVSKIGSLQ